MCWSTLLDSVWRISVFGEVYYPSQRTMRTLSFGMARLKEVSQCEYTTRAKQ